MNISSKLNDNLYSQVNIRRALFPLFSIALILITHIASAQAVHRETRTLFQTTSATTITNAFTAVSATGNLIVAHLSYSGQTQNILSVTDTKGNVYARINGPTNWGGVNYYRSELWYAYNITGGAGAISITATLSAAPSTAPDGLRFIQIYQSEFSGIGTTNPLDTKSVNTGSTTPFNSGSATSSYSNLLIYGAAIGGTMPAINAGATFTSLSNANSNRIEFRNAGAAGSNNANFTASGNGTYVAEMATFITTVSVLPIKLIDFNAFIDKGNIKLEWSTAQEINNDYFTIEKSSNPKEGFSVLTQIAGQGDSYVKYSYSAIDQSPFTGISYYRLKQTDYDGKFTYSKIVTADYKVSNTLMSIYPNPMLNEQSVIVRLVNSETTHAIPIVIYNCFGQKIIEQTIPASNDEIVQLTFSFDRPLLKGTYIVKAYTDLMLTQLLVVQ